MAETQGERLARIATLLEVISNEQTKMAADITALRNDLNANEKVIASLKNRGIGLLLGVGLAATALGMKTKEFLTGISSFFR